jgi:hypothetical protein
MPYLVYERSVGGKIVATIWPEMLITSQQKRPPHVKLIPIEGSEAAMSIDQLKERYPFETYNYSTETARSAQTGSKERDGSITITDRDPKTGSKVAITESEDILGSSRDRSNTDPSS